MTPKQQAKIIVFEYLQIVKYMYEAKQCALITVQQIINSNPHSNPFNTDVYSTMSYWLEVKKEIEAL